MGSTEVATCVIVAGELVYGAARSREADENTWAVNQFLDLLDVIPVSLAAAGEYGRLKAALLKRFGPREHARRRDFDLAKLGFSDNDLWIAAIALERSAVLVSSDRDFARIAEVADLGIENWTR